MPSRRAGTLAVSCALASDVFAVALVCASLSSVSDAQCGEFSLSLPCFLPLPFHGNTVSHVRLSRFTSVGLFSPVCRIVMECLSKTGKGFSLVLNFRRVATSH